jgi:chromatin assembly factor 1 subunit A
LVCHFSQVDNSLLTLAALIDPTLKSIDPFSTSYWQSPTAKTSMEPPRLPLTAMKNNSATINGLPAGSKSVKPFFSPASHIQTSSVASAQSPKDKDGKSKKLLDAGDLAAFKAALVGSDLSKIGLIEVLKKKFPKHSGAAIKNTLEAVASRGKKGEKEKDKRWVLIDA